MDEVTKDLAEKTRRRPGKKGKGRNREGYTQQGARHAVDVGAAFEAGVAAMALLPRSELGIEMDRMGTPKPRPKPRPGGGRTAYARSKQSFAYAAEEWSPEMGLNT